MKLQGSTEYILMLIGVIIVIIAGLVFVLKTGGTATKSGGLQAELLSAEAVGTNSIAFATNMQLPINSTSNVVNIKYNNGNTSGNFSIIGPYKVAGGYEYEITNIKAVQQSSLSSSNTIYIVPITITNNQNTPTGTYQQLITLQESNFANYITYNGNTANFFFNYTNNTHIPGWIESNNSGTLTIYFKLNNIPATSNTIVNLVFVNPSINELSNSGTSGIGEAPELSPSYGEYDDGPSVFNFYDNFAGTSLNTNLWTSSTTGGSITVNNGITFKTGTTTGPANAYIVGTIPLSTSIIEAFITSSTLYPGYGGINYDVGFSSSSVVGASGGSGTQNNFLTYVGASVQFWGDRFFYDLYDNSNTWFYQTGGSTLFGIAGSYYTPISLYIDDSLYLTSTTSYSGSVYPLLGISGAGNTAATPEDGTFALQWVRIRTYPPNGVMPSYTFGPIQTIIQSSSSIQQLISSISSITYTDINGNKVTLLPASGTNITVMQNGSFPFTISQIT